MTKSIAEKHGLRATFMPKPFAGLTGNGCHIHISLWDEDGAANLFHDPEGAFGLSETALHFLGGVLRHAPAMCAVTNPIVNSYKRINAPATASGATWSPNTVTWSGNNRTHMVRVPEEGRFELRLADGAANPYLLPAVCLAAGLEGIAKGVSPGRPLDIDMYAEGRRVRGARKLPLYLLDAIPPVRPRQGAEGRARRGGLGRLCEPQDGGVGRLVPAPVRLGAAGLARHIGGGGRRRGFRLTRARPEMLVSRREGADGAPGREMARCRTRTIGNSRTTRRAKRPGPEGLREIFEYRDLGVKAATKGDYIAHIVKANGKEQKDEVQHWHVHDCDFQFVLVLNGWAEFEYEGQGVRRIEKGDCINQRPGIRHREIACSKDFEVLEIVSPGRFRDPHRRGARRRRNGPGRRVAARRGRGRRRWTARPPPRSTHWPISGPPPGRTRTR